MDERTNKLLSRGSEITGSAIGAAIGALSGTAAWAAGSAAVGSVLSMTLRDVATRQLSAREEARIGSAAELVIDDVQRRIDSGEQPRGDFCEVGKKCTDAEELIEGVLLRAKDSYEQKKVPLLAKLCSNVLFDQTCTSSETNYLLNLFSQLSFTQLCILHFFSLRAEIKGRSSDLIHQEPRDSNQMALLELVKDLMNRNLVIQYAPGLEDRGDLIEVEPGAITPADCALTKLGHRVHQIFGLSSLTELDFMHLQADM